jgi:hypothetical protein
MATSKHLFFGVIFLGVSSILVIAFLVYRGVLSPQNILPSFAAGDQYGNKLMHFACADVGKSGRIVKMNYNDPRLKYSNEWGYKKGGGGSQICYQQDYHFTSFTK